MLKKRTKQYFYTIPILSAKLQIILLIKCIFSKKINRGFLLLLFLNDNCVIRDKIQEKLTTIGFYQRVLFKFDDVAPAGCWVWAAVVVADRVGKDVGFTFATRLCILLSAKHNSLATIDAINAVDSTIYFA